jgi:phospholipase/lecithinase/hemolysin
MLRTIHAVLSLYLLTSIEALPATIPLSKTKTIYSFGDSLSDTGNASIITLGVYPGSNYAPGRFTDGSNTTPAVPPGGPQGLWVEQLAGDIGRSAPSPVLSGGTDYAFASAESGTANAQDVGHQVTLFDLFHFWHAPSGGLYTFWAGANDVLDGANPVSAADDVMKDIQHLSNEGGKYFLWLNLPPLGNTPEGAGSASLNNASAAYDAEWAKDLLGLQSKGIDVAGVDIDALYDRIFSDYAAGCTPGPSDPYCFANVSSPAQGHPGVNPDTYLFWDSIHPTTEADKLAAEWAEDAMLGLKPSVATGGSNAIDPVPEPTSFAFGLLGLAIVGVVLKAAALTAPSPQRSPE